MKKILFLQIKGNSLGGVWFVDKTLGEEFLNRGYDVKVIGIRNNHPDGDIKDTSLPITVINKKDRWEITHKHDLIDSFLKKGFLKVLRKYISDQKKLKNDYKKLFFEINKYNPDYIFATHYEVLKGIPSRYLKKTIFVQHSSFAYLCADKKNVKVLRMMENKVHGFYWLSKSCFKEAAMFGFRNNNYIYNPVKFTSSKRADVSLNKKIVVVTRIHPEKRIDLMVKLVNDVFKDKKFKEWSFEIYGIGNFNEESTEILKNSKQIFYKGLSSSPKDVLLKGSLTLNTSLFEGFSLSIIEGFECGLPVITFNFGEASGEQVINDYNGYVVNSENEFREKLILLMSDLSKLDDMSKNAKKFAGQFEINNIIVQWGKVFKDIDKERL